MKQSPRYRIVSAFIIPFIALSTMLYSQVFNNDRYRPTREIERTHMTRNRNIYSPSHQCWNYTDWQTAVTFRNLQWKTITGLRKVLYRHVALCSSIISFLLLRRSACRFEFMKRREYCRVKWWNYWYNLLWIK